MPDQTVLVHPELPDVEVSIHPRGARVLAASGWVPKPVTAVPAPDPGDAPQDTPPPVGDGKPPRKNAKE